MTGITKIQILEAFPLFATRGFGFYKPKSLLTIQSIKQVIPALSQFNDISLENKNFKNKVLKFLEEQEYKNNLGDLFNKYRSDKASMHNYYLIYASILNEIKDPKNIFEIGLGTNNIDIVSYMGANAIPGASLRAFKEYLPNSFIYGADVDKRILFNEERIKTYFLDQTDPSSFDSLREFIPDNFDLMIDDGLHSPNANLHSLKFFIEYLNVGGYAVIEDINEEAEPLWKVVSSLIEPQFKSAFIKTKSRFIFIAKKEF